MKPEAENWLNLAESDFDAAGYLFDGARYPQAVYILCQAIEKILKAAQVEFGDEPPKKTHNLRAIASRTGMTFPDEHITALRALDRDYTRVRYRDIAQSWYNTRAKTQPIMERGETLYVWIRNRLISL